MEITELVKTEIKGEIKGEINIYARASELKISEEEQKKLLFPFPVNEIEIRPDGIIYLPQAFCRERLNQSFGIGQWVLIPKASNKDTDRDKLYLPGVLMIRGIFVAEAIGEAELHSKTNNAGEKIPNPMQSWASVWESAKSDCITRCCKDLGIASELWQPQFREAWKKENAIQVWREKTGKKKDGTPGSFQWRKKTAQPFYDEKINTVPKTEKPAIPNAIPPVKQTQDKKYVLEPITRIKNCKSIKELTELYNSMPVAQQKAEHIISYFTKQKDVLKIIKSQN